MSRPLQAFAGSLTLAATLTIAGHASASPYDTMVLADRPVLYLPLSAPLGSTVERDLSPSHRNGAYLPAGSQHGKARMQNGDTATVFNGSTQYLQVPSHASLSIPTRGALTIEAWIRPDVLEFPRQEGDGYVHWAGKGAPGQHEYALRMYSLTNSASRPNRISGYAFNPDGGLGSGSYFQDAVTANRWLHVAVVVDGDDVRIFKNGVLRDTTPLSQFDVVPEAGNAPLRVATRDFRSFFKGAVGKFAVYGYPLTEAQLRRHFREMTRWR